MGHQIFNREFTLCDVASGYDHCITDPPYSPHTHTTGATMRGGKAGRNDFGFGSLTEDLRNAIAQQVSECRSWSVIFSDWQGLSEWDNALHRHKSKVIRVIPWVRWSMPQLSGDRPPQGWEPVIIAYGYGSGKKSWHGPGNLTHFDEKCMRGAGKHKTQKPLDLMCRLVRYFSEPGASIFDPCAGRGTTVLAAKLLGRGAVGCEVDSAEAALAQERMMDLDQRDLLAFRRDAARAELEDEDRKRMRDHTAKVRSKRATP